MFCTYSSPGHRPGVYSPPGRRETLRKGPSLFSNLNFHRNRLRGRHSAEEPRISRLARMARNKGGVGLATALVLVVLTLSSARETDNQTEISGSPSWTAGTIGVSLEVIPAPLPHSLTPSAPICQAKSRSSRARKSSLSVEARGLLPSNAN